MSDLLGELTHDAPTVAVIESKGGIVAELELGPVSDMMQVMAQRCGMKFPDGFEWAGFLDASTYPGLPLDVALYVYFRRLNKGKDAESNIDEAGMWPARTRKRAVEFVTKHEITDGTERWNQVIESMLKEFKMISDSVPHLDSDGSDDGKKKAHHG